MHSHVKKESINKLKKKQKKTFFSPYSSSSSFNCGSSLSLPSFNNEYFDPSHQSGARKGQSKEAIHKRNGHVDIVSSKKEVRTSYY